MGKVSKGADWLIEDFHNISHLQKQLNQFCENKNFSDLTINKKISRILFKRSGRIKLITCIRQITTIRAGYFIPHRSKGIYRISRGETFDVATFPSRAHTL
jgi:hypothetical protein